MNKTQLAGLAVLSAGLGSGITAFVQDDSTPVEAYGRALCVAAQVNAGATKDAAEALCDGSAKHALAPHVDTAVSRTLVAPDQAETEAAVLARKAALRAREDAMRRLDEENEFAKHGLGRHGGGRIPADPGEILGEVSK